MFKLLLFICSTISFYHVLDAKILMITHAFNRPDFIDLQIQTFESFLEDEYELVVFNDANDSSMEQAINLTCERHGIRVFRVPQHLHFRPGRESAGHRHMDGVQYALDLIGYDYNGIVALIDSDAFLIKPFSIEHYMSGKDVAGKIEGRTNGSIRVRHLSPVLAFMDMRTLPNKRSFTFEGGYIHGLACDVGAHTYYYLKNNPNVSADFFQSLRVFFLKLGIGCRQCSNFSCAECVWHLIDKGFDDSMIQFVQECPDDNMEFVLNHHFMHYRCGSNWNHKPSAYHQQKTNALYAFINNVLQKRPINQ